MQREERTCTRREGEICRRWLHNVQHSASRQQFGAVFPRLLRQLNLSDERKANRYS